MYRVHLTPLQRVYHARCAGLSRIPRGSDAWICPAHAPATPEVRVTPAKSAAAAEKEASRDAAATGHSSAQKLAEKTAEIQKVAEKTAEIFASMDRSAIHALSQALGVEVVHIYGVSVSFYSLATAPLSRLTLAPAHQ